MKTHFLVLLFAVLLALPAACTAGKAANRTQFHPPQTEAEKALDHILMLDNTDGNNLGLFMFRMPGRHMLKDDDFSPLFTQPLLDAWFKAYMSIPQEEGGERYVDIDFITCGQDTPDNYLYATVKDDGREAYINTAWPQFVDNTKVSTLPPYRMIKEAGVWKLDGVKCPEGFVFNTDFHHTR